MQSYLVDIYDPHVGIINLSQNITNIESFADDIKAIHSTAFINLRDYPNLVSFVLTPTVELDNKKYYKVIIRLPYLSKIKHEYFQNVDNVVITSSSYGGIYASDINRILYKLRRYKGNIIIDSNIDYKLKDEIANKHLGCLYFGVKNAGYCCYFPNCVDPEEYNDIIKLELSENHLLNIPSFFRFNKSAMH